MTKFTIIVVSAAILIITGCGKKTEQPGSQVSEQKQQTVKTLDKDYAPIKVAKKLMPRKQLEGGPFVVPEITGYENVEVMKKINSIIESDAAKHADSFVHPYEVDHNTGGLLSIQTMYTVFDDRPYDIYSTFNFDMETGEPVTLDMFFDGAKNWRAKVAELCREEMAREGTDLLECPANGSTLREFTFDDTGITFFFHEIAATYVSLPWTVLDPYLNKNGIWKRT